MPHLSSLALLIFLSVNLGAMADEPRAFSDARIRTVVHPSILASPDDREAIRQKIAKATWAKAAFAGLKSQVDPLVAKCEADPQFMSSRLFMHWKTRYTIPLVSNSRWVGGEGVAPIPTPRFGGARDWAIRYALPAKLEDLKPYNENEQSQVWLRDNETGEERWIDAGLTGRMFETTNERILYTAADAAFIYWITGDERYARYASQILCTYTDGFAHMQPPKMLEGERSMSKIIGVTSFEVIHEDVVTAIALTYDFLCDYLKRQGKDATVVQSGLKRMIDRVVAGGGREGNWNLNQARIIAYGGLALEENLAYTDQKGRGYYADIVLNADLPNQRGITHVLRESLDPETALWAEAAGYGFGSVKDLILLATLVSSDPAGRKMLDDPLLARAAIAPLQMCYPNGRSNGVGDTTNSRIPMVSLELLIANARRRGNASQEAVLTAALRHETDSGAYDRNKSGDLLALAKYVGELLPVDESITPLVTTTFFHKPLNVFVQRNLADDPEHGLAASLFGTAGGHVHANGLAIELYGAGVILGADPGRGVSYWQAEHGEYYSQPPAHNTVIVNGTTSYPSHGRGAIAMKLESCEPQPLEVPMSQHFSYATASFEYPNPSAQQKRTLALVRTGAKSGFYFDVYRSRATSNDNSFHDYLYHNIGQSLTLDDADGKPLSTQPSKLLAGKGYLKGYDYFKNEKSLEISRDFRATFSGPVHDTERKMDVWMPGATARRVFTVDAPINRAVRDALPQTYSQIPMPTLLVRQHGDAWSTPFVAIYEPYIGSEGRCIQSVRTVKVDEPGIAACVVEGQSAIDGKVAPFRVYLVQADDASKSIIVDGHPFKGAFSAILLRDGQVIESYLPAEKQK